MKKIFETKDGRPEAVSTKIEYQEQLTITKPKNLM